MAGKKKPLRADLHIHTFYSGDNKITPEDIIEQAEKANLDVVGVVDHKTNRGGMKTRELAKKLKLVVLPGQEVLTSDGEIIVLGIDDELENNMDLLQTCRHAKKRGGIVIIPHPFDISRHGIGKHMEGIMKFIDAIEVFNSRSILRRFNQKAFEFAKKHKKPMIAASDAHTRGEIGSSITLLYSGKNEQEILNAIKSGKTKIIAGTAGIRNRLKGIIKNRILH